MKQDILLDEYFDTQGCFLFKLNWGMWLGGKNTADTRTECLGLGFFFFFSFFMLAMPFKF